MANGVENASLKETKIEYLKLLRRLNVARTHYETSEKMSEKILGEINYYKTEIRNYENILRKRGVSPEDMLCKRTGNAPKIIGAAKYYPL